MPRRCNYDILNKCVDYILGSYKFEDYLRKYGLFNEDLLKAGKVVVGYNQIKIPCPFPPHVDYDPSLVINTQTNQYNCFGCEEGGNLITFISHYETKVNNHKMSYLNTVELMLKNDRALRLHVGCDSIFSETPVTLNAIRDLRLRSSLAFKSKIKEPSSFLDLSRSILKEFDSDTEVIKVAISLMQDGLDARSIYKFINNNKSSPTKTEKKEESEIDVSEILGDSYD